MADDGKKKVPMWLPPPPRRGPTEVPNLNWVNALDNLTALSAGLVAFPLAFIVFIIGLSIGASKTLGFGVTWQTVGVLLNGISAILFVAGAEFFATAKEYNLWGLPIDYEQYLEKLYGPERWEEIKKKTQETTLDHEERGRHCYNGAIMLMFGALFFVVGPYNLVTAIILSGAGILLECYQWVQTKRLHEFT